MNEKSKQFSQSAAVTKRMRERLAGSESETSGTKLKKTKQNSDENKIDKYDQFAVEGCGKYLH